MTYCEAKKHMHFAGPPLSCEICRWRNDCVIFQKLEQARQRIKKDLGFEKYLAFEKEGLPETSRAIHQSRYGLLKDLLELLEGKVSGGSAKSYEPIKSMSPHYSVSRHRKRAQNQEETSET